MIRTYACEGCKYDNSCDCPRFYELEATQDLPDTCEDRVPVYINYRPMPEDKCGYCRFCTEKTLEYCDEVAGEKEIPICEDCAKERGLTDD